MNLNYEVNIVKTATWYISNYCYIIVDKTTNNALIIDPSWEFDKISDKLLEIDVNLIAIALTHSHFDHVNLVNTLIDKFNPYVYMSKAEIDYYGFRCKNLQGLNDLDKIQIGETKAVGLLTPGHTKGGMCYLFSESIFTGDTIFTEGCGICSCDGSSASQMFDSIQRVKALVADNVRVYPGHSYGKGPDHTMEYLKKWNIYLKIVERQNFIDFRMRKSQKGLFKFK